MTTVITIDGRRTARLSAGWSMTPVHGEVTVNIGGEVVDLKIEAPSGPTTVQEMLPILHGLTDVYVALATEGGHDMGTIARRSATTAGRPYRPPPSRPCSPPAPTRRPTANSPRPSAAAWPA